MGRRERNPEKRQQDFSLTAQGSPKKESDVT